MKLDYFVTSEIWLSLEHYYNSGLTTEEVKQEIEDICVNPRLKCSKMGYNGNWIVETGYVNPNDIEELVFRIRMRLDNLLLAKL